MIELTQGVPKDEERHALPLVRTPAKGVLRAIITTHTIVGTYTHWYAGKTQPCRGDNCKACSEGAPSRWLGYLAARIADGPRHAVIEVPRTAAEAIFRAQEEMASLRFRLLELTRLSKRPNGRVAATILPDDMRDRQIPEPPDMMRVLATIWQVKLADFEPGPLRSAGRQVTIGQEDVHTEADPAHVSEITNAIRENSL